MTKLATICIVFWSIAIVLVIDSYGHFLPKRMLAPFNIKERVFSDPKKRPFCNAFTGCGRKRSNLPALSPDGEELEDSLNSLLELSAEPAVQDLSRQIMSEAKLWEAIQEANVELNRRKYNRNMDDTDDDVGTPARSATASCALPPCYI